MSAEPPDPHAVTQPQPIVTPGDHPVLVSTIPHAPPKPDKGPYAPVFGSLGGYAFSRFAALVIDFAIIPSIVACFVFNLADRGTLAFAPRTQTGFEWIAGIALAIAFAFAILFESILETTLGKALFGLGIRRGNGRHAGLHRIVLRYVLLPIDLLAIGPILAIVTRRHQRLGDFAAGTVVARHRIGGFITGLALVLFAGLIYAQATIGGGITSILGVTAEGSFFLPTIVGGLFADLGLGTHPDTPTVMPSSDIVPPDPRASE